MQINYVLTELEGYSAICDDENGIEVRSPTSIQNLCSTMGTAWLLRLDLVLGSGHFGGATASIEGCGP
jgi:hypothetical protein